jgi:hypothetical protein
VWIERALLELQDKNVSTTGRAAVCVPYFGAVAPMLEVTDMIATLPRRLALRLAERDSLVLLKLPYKPITSKSKWPGTSESRGIPASVGSEKY